MYLGKYEGIPVYCIDIPSYVEKYMDERNSPLPSDWTDREKACHKLGMDIVYMALRSIFDDDAIIVQKSSNK